MDNYGNGKVITTDNDIKELISYVASEKFGVSIDNKYLEILLQCYHQSCENIKKHYVTGALDTFKKSAVLISEIAKSSIVPETVSFSKSRFAFEVGLLMCENPIRNIGENYDEPQDLAKVNYELVFSGEHADVLERLRKNRDLIDEKSLSLFDIAHRLELLYYIAIQITNSKQKTECSNGSNAATLEKKYVPMCQINGVKL
jgi:hypothetical protein